MCPLPGGITNEKRLLFPFDTHNEILMSTSQNRLSFMNETFIIVVIIMLSRKFASALAVETSSHSVDNLSLNLLQGLDKSVYHLLFIQKIEYTKS